MIGIYLITNKINGKQYVGQSGNINRRFLEHSYKGKESRIPLDVAIKKYGKDNFKFEILEECPLEELNDRESFWIKKLKTDKFGYNCNQGGEQAKVGENNGRAKLTNEDVMIMRKAYARHERSRDVYEKYFSDKTTYAYFLSVWEGHFWVHIMPEVFTEENRNYYMKETTIGEKSPLTKMTDEQVLKCRRRYVNETAREIYDDIKPAVTYATFQAILWGRRFKHLPVYDKKKKCWTQPLNIK